jgi:hypothetical protein
MSQELRGRAETTKEDISSGSEDDRFGIRPGYTIRTINDQEYLVPRALNADNTLSLAPVLCPDYTGTMEKTTGVSHGYIVLISFKLEYLHHIPHPAHRTPHTASRIPLPASHIPHTTHRTPHNESRNQRTNVQWESGGKGWQRGLFAGVQIR